MRLFMRLARFGFLALLTVTALAVGSGISLAGNPRGNNGTVKVDGVVFDKHPDNEPHVGCKFEIDFYGFDKGDLYATATFEAQSPSGRGALKSYRIFIGEDSNAGGGSEAGLDAQLPADLGDVVGRLKGHPQQGYHIKLTVNADGSQGATTKHKVFWVRGCTPDASGGTN
jgi:hypothetical protein